MPHRLEELRITLHELDNELRSVESLDAETMEMLKTVTEEIQIALKKQDPDALEHRSLIELLRESTESFESSHPALSGVVGRMTGDSGSQSHTYLLHASNHATMPDLELRGDKGLRWSIVNRQGNPPETIVQVADELESDMIIMVTEGHHGFLDALRGSTTDVFSGDRRVHCWRFRRPALLASGEAFTVSAPV